MTMEKNREPAVCWGHRTKSDDTTNRVWGATSNNNLRTTTTATVERGKELGDNYEGKSFLEGVTLGEGGRKTGQQTSKTHFLCRLRRRVRAKGTTRVRGRNKISRLSDNKQI